MVPPPPCSYDECIESANFKQSGSVIILLSQPQVHIIIATLSRLYLFCLFFTRGRSAFIPHDELLVGQQEDGFISHFPFDFEVQGRWCPTSSI